MSKTVKIPEWMNPWKAIINGNEYVYEAGTEQTVPDEVAGLIERQRSVMEGPQTVPPPFSAGGGVTSWNDLTDRPFGESYTVYMNATGSGRMRYGYGFDSMYNHLTGEADTYANAFLIENDAFYKDVCFQKVGKEITVVFDGVEYVVAGVGVTTSESFPNNEGYFGNGALINSAYSDTGEPFALYCDGATPITLFPDTAEHTIIVKVANVQTLPEKYLPEGVGGGESDVFGVLVTYSTAEPAAFTCNKTFAEMEEAWGKKVIWPACYQTDGDNYYYQPAFKKHDKDTFSVDDMFYFYRDGTFAFAGGA